MYLYHPILLLVESDVGRVLSHSSSAGLPS